MTHSSDQYDAIAALWREAENHVLRVGVERPTLLAAIGDIGGADLIDLACGSGAYPQLFVERGASRVLGVDASAEMIEMAGRREQPAPARITYRHHNVATMPALGAFDLATAVYLLNYARDKDELAAMCRAVHANLRPGGRFAGAVPNSAFDPSRPTNPAYGLAIEPQHVVAEGEEVTGHLTLSRTVTIRYRHWHLDTYRTALEAAGLRSVEFRPQLPSEESLAGTGQDFWQDWIDNPINVVVTAQRPG